MVISSDARESRSRIEIFLGFLGIGSRVSVSGFEFQKRDFLIVDILIVSNEKS